MIYEIWYALANLKVIQMAGVRLEDLGDGMSYDAYKDGMLPEEYAEERLRDEGFPF